MLMKTCLAMMLGLAMVRAARAEEFIFQTATARLALDDRGFCTSLRDKVGGAEWIAAKPVAFFAVRKNGAAFAATKLTPNGRQWHVEFGVSGVTADLNISAHQEFLRIDLVQLNDADVDSLDLANLALQPLQHSGNILGVLWDERFAVALLGLSDCVNVTTGGNRLAATVYREFALAGQGVALLATPPEQMLAQVQAVERACGLPSPQLGGKWAKQSQDVATSYLFGDLTEENADEMIRYAKLGGLGYIMTYSWTWAQSLGSYPINMKNFPHGQEGLKAVADKCHKAGLKVGLHMLTSFVSKVDPLVRPKPDPRLLKDDHAVLAADIDATVPEVAATAALTSFPIEGAFYGGQKAGCDIQIDDEIIQYRAIGGADKNTFLKCVRGFAGTTATPHAAGTPILHLVERYGCYLADLRTTLKGQISQRIADIINRCGFDMIYFDGGECNGANGPTWYWVSQQQCDICQRVNRPLLVQGSGNTPWTWHWFARGCCDDFAAVATKQYLDNHKIADSWVNYHNSFLPAELGWWGFLGWTPHHSATTPDEVEFYAIRMLALDAPVSLETHLSDFKQNGRTEEMLQLLGDYERLRLGGTVPATIRNQLRTGQWRRVGNTFLPIRYDTQRLGASGECAVANAFAAQPLQFRLQCVPTLATPGAAGNLLLLNPAAPLPLPQPDAQAAMPGALAARIEFTRQLGDQYTAFMVGAPAPATNSAAGKPLDLLQHRALAVRLAVADTQPAGQPPPVINIQLEAGGKTYRDYYINLDFVGQRTIILPEPTTERMLGEFRPAHANYAFKAAMYHFDYHGIIALNIRWMRTGRTPMACTVAQIEALTEIATPLKQPVLEIGTEKFALPVKLDADDYAEFQGKGDIRIFDKQGRLLQTIQPDGRVPVLPAGPSRIGLRAAEGGAAKLTLITLGDPLPPPPASAPAREP